MLESDVQRILDVLHYLGKLLLVVSVPRPEPEDILQVDTKIVSTDTFARLIAGYNGLVLIYPVHKFGYYLIDWGRKIGE